jgi:proteasome lid subunit RPN8/RPN11
MGFRKTKRSEVTRRHSRRADEGEEGERRRVWGIQREMLMGILEIAKEKYPREFLATMTHRRGVIYEINIIPGTIEGDSFSVLQPFMQPPDLKFKVCGSVHSHPSPSARPSRADIIFFGKNGNTHIIVAYPFTLKSWRAYDGHGNPVSLEIVD